jgi:bifunctional non-homologous end joining protein LigD
LRDLLNKLGLDSFPKTSGSKGLQVYVPLNTLVTYEQTKPFARHIAELLEREHAEQIVSKMSKSLRGGRVFIDWSQNDDHKTTVNVYSLRAKEEPTVSTALTWDEVSRALKHNSPDRLKFLAEAILQRVKTKGDLFSAVLKQKQRLPKLTCLKQHN